jgi:hypothetical protein
MRLHAEVERRFLERLGNGSCLQPIARTEDAQLMMVLKSEMASTIRNPMMTRPKIV